MPGGYIQNDPTTWTDWRDPSSRGFVKVDCLTGLEMFFEAGWKLCALAAVLTLWIALTGGRRHPVTSTDPRFYLVAIMLIFTAAVLLTGRLLTDNFFLVDPSRHVVYLHSMFLFNRRVRLLLERQDIAGVATEAQRRRSKYRSWTVHRTVLVNKSGGVVPMSDFVKDGLWASNNLARELGRQLEVPSYEATEDTRLKVTSENGQTSITHEPFSWFGRLDSTRLGMLGAVVFILVVMGVLAWFKR